MSLDRLKAIVTRAPARVAKSLRKRGVLGTIRVAWVYGSYRVRFRVREWRFDRALGVNTRGTEGPANKNRILAGIESDLKHALTGFGPSDPALIEHLLKSVPIRHEEFAFVDIGSGSGRVVLIASDWPFRKVLGVELSPDLHETTSRNLRNRKGRAPRCQDIGSVCADATTHPIPSGPVLLFLHNPFREEALLERFLSHVERSWKASPRPIVLIYVNPRLAFVFEKFPLFRKLAPLWPDCLLYRTPDSSTEVGRPDEQVRAGVFEGR